MDNRQLNNLAIKAKCGCEDSLWEIKGVFIRKIHEMSSHNWHSISNEEKFEESCFTKIERAVRTFDPRKGNFYTLVMIKLNSLLRKSRKRYSKKPQVVSLSDKVDGTDIEIGSMLIDESAFIDYELMVNEKIALISKGDPRKEMILKLWASGVNKTKYIAGVIAKNQGGNISSHETYIHRFRARCRKALA